MWYKNNNRKCPVFFLFLYYKNLSYLTRQTCIQKVSSKFLHNPFVIAQLVGGFMLSYSLGWGSRVPILAGTTINWVQTLPRTLSLMAEKREGHEVVRWLELIVCEGSCNRPTHAMDSSWSWVVLWWCGNHLIRWRQDNENKFMETIKIDWDSFLNAIY